MWCGVVWFFFFGSTLLQHRARRAAHAGEKATSLERRAPDSVPRAWGRRGPTLVPTAARKAGVRHRPGWCSQTPHFSCLVRGRRVGTVTAPCEPFALACVGSPGQAGRLPRPVIANPRGGGATGC